MGGCTQPCTPTCSKDHPPITKHHYKATSPQAHNPHKNSTEISFHLTILNAWHLANFNFSQNIEYMEPNSHLTPPKHRKTNGPRLSFNSCTKFFRMICLVLLSTDHEAQILFVLGFTLPYPISFVPILVTHVAIIHMMVRSFWSYR